MNHHVPPVGQAAGLGIGRRRNKVGASDTTAAEEQAAQQQQQLQVIVMIMYSVLLSFQKTPTMQHLLGSSNKHFYALHVPFR